MKIILNSHGKRARIHTLVNVPASFFKDGVRTADALTYQAVADINAFLAERGITAKRLDAYPLTRQVRVNF